ncbi:ATP-binding SpoIIE family protein phosphatase [Streptomyces acidicola]|uniref:ATP-binding SpoIIE family protein phosphatase n=1 Tax=Streptomyces acidicola TaxID=2596892 RepID=UPI00341D81E3
MRLPANEFAPAAARRFVRAVIAERTASALPGSLEISGRWVEDAVLLVGELVISTATPTGFEVEITCRVEAGAGQTGVVIEVVDRHPSRIVSSDQDIQSSLRSRGLQLVRALATSWGITYRRAEKAVWFQLEAPLEPRDKGGDDASAGELQRDPAAPGTSPAALPRKHPGHSTLWADRGGESFLAEASELLAGQLDEDMVAALAGQLLVPRLADWCGVWLSTDSGGMRLSRIWHRDERHIGGLRLALERDRPPPARLSTTGIPWPWPEGTDATGAAGSALAFPLVAGGRCHGVLLLGLVGLSHMTDAVTRLAEDLARRVAQAVVTARHYTREVTISRTLQSQQLPASIAVIPGIDTAIVYEPAGEGQTVGGDFYDLFPIGDHRWCFLLGDVSGHDLVAMSATGLARHLVRLLAREGHGVESLLSRLNLAMAEESAEAVAYGSEQAGPRFLSLLYGELEPDVTAGGAHCTIASAGHPLPLRLTADGSVAPAADPQILLGVDEHAEFHANSFTLAPGEALLCVTDGVTERRSGNRQLDDNDGLAEVLRGCVGLGAKAVAELVRQATHDFGSEPIDDDLAVLVLEAVPVLGRSGHS